MKRQSKQEKYLLNLEGAQSAHRKLTEMICTLQGGKQTPVDLLAMAVIKRSMTLLASFCLLIRNRYFVSAAPLIRMQLDNLLRFHAAFISEDPHKFALRVFQGEHVSIMKDKQGGKLNDAYLKKSFVKHNPEFVWIVDVYDYTSGYVHFSEKHFYHILTGQSDDANRTVKFCIGEKEAYIPDKMIVEAIIVMTKITKGLLWYLRGWVDVKGKGGQNATDKLAIEKG